MPRLSTTFSDEIYEKLQAGATKKSLPISQYVRDLVTSALSSEAYNASPERPASETAEIEKCQGMSTEEMLETSMAWLMETRLLARILVEDSKALSGKNSVALLDSIKDKARHYVELLNRADRD